jgi:hypothetical protein
MNVLKKFRGASAPVWVLVALLLISSAVPQGLAATNDEGSVCQEALEKCAFDALVTFVTAGWVAGAIYSYSCLMGYEFCLRYIRG